MAKRRKIMKEKLKTLFFLICAIPYASIISLVAKLVFIICAGTLLNYELESYKQSSLNQDLSNLIVQTDGDSVEDEKELEVGGLSSMTDSQDSHNQVNLKEHTPNAQEDTRNVQAGDIYVNGARSSLHGKSINPSLSKEQILEYMEKEKQIQMELSELKSMLQTYLKPYELETIQIVSGSAYKMMHEDGDEKYKAQEEKLYQQIESLEKELKTIQETLYVTDTIVHNKEKQEDLVQEREAQDHALKKYQVLIGLNQDFYGWLTIEGTNIDLPVVTTANNEYYLTHDFYQEESKYGTLFLDYQSDVTKPSRNLIIYGHNMSDGSMLHDLLEYKDEQFYEEHKTFSFDTIYGKETYEVVAAFYSQVYNKDDEVFKYYKYMNPTKTEMTEFLKQIKKLSRYDTKVDSSNDDFYVTLSTCAYHKKNGRFVVVGRRIKN